MFDDIAAWLRAATWTEATLAFLAENVLIFGLAVVIGNWIARRESLPRVSARPGPITTTEIVVAAQTIVLNTVVTLVGWRLWLAGVVRFRSDSGLGAVLDVFVLLLAMDALMYWLHRIAHVPPLFGLLHQFHHRYDRVRPLTLFALNPFETLAFGALWLAVISVYAASWAGMSAYLALNVAFGAVGHLGVEIVPKSIARGPGLRHVAGSSFHAQHHQDRNFNFGFYTLIWDRLFGTLRSDYDELYGQLPRAEQGGDSRA